jgi:hypothetical protein
VIENPMTFQVGWPIPNSDLVVNCNATGPNITIVTAEGRIQLSSTTPVVYVPCQPTITVLCAENGRFSVGFEAIALDGRVIPGQVRHGDQYPDGGFFYVPDLNIEALVKVLNACHLNDRFWVFASAVTDIEMNLTVTDTRTGVMQLYRNARGQPGRAVEDQNAFATCGQ